MSNQPHTPITLILAKAGISRARLLRTLGYSMSIVSKLKQSTCRRTSVVLLIAISLLGSGLAAAVEGEKPRDITYITAPPAPQQQTWEQANDKNLGCISCHKKSDQKTMHSNPGVVLACTDCHGGNEQVVWNGVLPQTPSGHDYDENHHRWPEDFQAQMDLAHVLPRYPNSWHYPSSANPPRSYTLLNREAPEFVRFINPGDYRVAEEACGACHQPIINAAKRSLMATSAMFWGGAAYNNGILPNKRYILGETYDRDGNAVTIESPIPIDASLERRGNLSGLYPLPYWQTVPPADVFRVFERGGRNLVNLFPETGLPNPIGNIQRLEEPGRPDQKQSNRAKATGNRIAVPVLNIHKTRLNDPNMWFMGTNDNPGDFRHSGCTSCHVIYANDREPLHSGPYSEFGHLGKTQTSDPLIPKQEPGHPLQHTFTRAIPSSQCMNCHMHQPNMFMNTFLGYTMWDYESDAPSMWPQQQKYPSSSEAHEILERNPEEAAIRGKWGDLEFLQQVSEMNPELKDTQFADYHGHGWNFRAVFKRDREGSLLDKQGNIVADDDPDKFKKAVHLRSMHSEVGMQCADCHFAQDSHGNGLIQSEVMGAVEIRCRDCHGTADQYPTLITSGPAAPPKGNDLSLLRNPDGKKRFEWIGDKLIQRSVVTPGLEWQMSLVKDTMDPAHISYNEKAARAKLVKQLPKEAPMTEQASFYWGLDVLKENRAHNEDEMLCYACHTSWTTTCAGCHLPIQANWKTDNHHYEGKTSRNYATYNPQVARDQMFMLGRHGDIKDNMIAPVRSSSALVLSSQNANRERIYVQQPPVSASGYSSQAFAPHFPHTARKEETKQCNDCHISTENDNNAIMAQLLGLGTNFLNFVGLNVWAGGDGRVEAIRVTEFDEPQAVIGSYLHKYAYPDWYQKHQNNEQELQEAYSHRAASIGCLQLRGEYLYVAQGRKGFQAYDVANIANKGFSQRFITAPFSPWGHSTRIKSKNATCVALPTNQPIYPDRNQGELMREINREQAFHPIYNYALITDSKEGLILTDINTLADGDFQNNFLKRIITWNPDGRLDGARYLKVAGHMVYIATDKEILVADLDNPLEPKIAASIALSDVRGFEVQFRYLFATTGEGLKVVDITLPEKPQIVESALVPLTDAHRVYVARTYAYVAAGKQGLAIIDVTKPEQPELLKVYNADGNIKDARDVIVGSTNASLFAYIADGEHGLKVVQLTSPELQPKFYGFSPEPKPQLIAHYPSRSPLLSLSKGLSRDRAVDETGHQMAVFGRLGSKPFSLEEMRKLYLTKDNRIWPVKNNTD